MGWRLIGAEQKDKVETSCENCGHEIAQEYYLRDSATGAEMTVGCECVKLFIESEQAQTADLMRRRLQRAATQWRKGEPAPKPGESRTEYINRRVKEMPRAWKAYCAWAAAQQTWYRKMQDRSGEFASNLLDRYGIPNGDQHDPDERAIWLHHREIWYQLIDVYQRTRTARMAQRVASNYGANAYDFTNRRSWDIKSL